MCEICDKGYYLTNSDSTCCKNGSYCADASTTVAGNVKNCERYNTSADDCTHCANDHSLMTLSDSSKYCYPTPF